MTFTLTSRYLFIASLLPVFGSINAYASGLTRDGTSSRSQAIGGTNLTSENSALDAMSANPAQLTTIDKNAVELNGNGIFLRGELQRDDQKTSRLQNRINFLGDVAIAIPTSLTSLTLGAAVTPSYAAKSRWRFRDTEGGLDGKTTYGTQESSSEFLALDFKIGLGWELAPWFSAGASIGIVYNQNSLHGAYVFQSQETLAGNKTLLDLETDGLGVVGQIGFTIRPAKNVIFSVSYITPTEIHSDGSAQADLSAQFDSLGGGFAGANPKLDTNAEILTKLPQKVSVGITWMATEKFAISAQYDWVNWSAAFDDLAITLTDSSNSDVNALVGSSTIRDVVPLNWKDQHIFRLGAEYRLTDRWSLRAGYSHSNQVIPQETLTPWSAAIDQDVITAGLGYELTNWHFDFSWQWHLANQENINRSDLKSGEFQGNELELESHWFGLTVGYFF